MALFINVTESIGQIITNGTTIVTGSIVATLFIILIILIVLAFMFQIPLEFLGMFILPFCLVLASFYGVFLLAVIIFIIFVSLIIAKNWIFK